MFENIRSGNIGIQLNRIGYYIRAFECKIYKDKTIKDFVFNIYKNTHGNEDIYTIQMDNIKYKYCFPYKNYECLLLSEIHIQIENIIIYRQIYWGHQNIWEYSVPKEILRQIKQHSQILKQYNKQLKEYFRYNNDYAIEQRKLNGIFSK